MWKLKSESEKMGKVKSEKNGSVRINYWDGIGQNCAKIALKLPKISKNWLNCAYMREYFASSWQQLGVYFFLG